MQSPDTVPSFFANLRFQSRVRPHAKAIIADDLQVSYAVFARHVELMSRRLQGCNLPAGTPVAVMVKNTYLKWVANIAAMRLGWLGADAVSQQEIGVIDPHAVIVDGSTTVEAPRLIRIGPDWLQDGGEDPGDFGEPLHDADAPCRMVLSSGTTGTPKRIVFSYGELLARIRLSPAIYGTNSNTRTMSMMGGSTIGGFTTPLSVWSVGGGVVFPARKGQGRMWEVLQLEPTSLLLAPSQLQQLLDDLPPHWLPPRELTIYVAGSSLSRALSRRARARLSQQLFIVYGSTEAGSVAVTHAVHTESRPGFSGYLVPSAQVEVIDEDGKRVPPGTEGEVRLRTDALIASYWQSQDDSLRDGWFYPGDTGILHPDGGLTITGRVRELINAGGAKISPALADEALAGLPGVKDVAVFGLELPQGTRACIAVVPGEGFEPKVLQQRFKEIFRGAPAPVLARVSRIPRNEMGKVVRHQLAELVRESAAKKEPIPAD